MIQIRQWNHFHYYAWCIYRFEMQSPFNSIDWMLKYPELKFAFIWIAFPKSAKYHTFAQSLNKLLYLDMLHTNCRIDVWASVIEETRFNLLWMLNFQISFHSLPEITYKTKRNTHKSVKAITCANRDGPWNGNKVRRVWHNETFIRFSLNLFKENSMNIFFLCINETSLSCILFRAFCCFASNTFQWKDENKL